MMLRTPPAATLLRKLVVEAVAAGAPTPFRTVSGSSAATTSASVAAENVAWY